MKQGEKDIKLRNSIIWQLKMYYIAIAVVLLVIFGLYVAAIVVVAQ